MNLLRKPWTVTAILLLLSAQASAQNLVTNGDFEKNTSAAWSFSGYAVQPKVMSYNTTGSLMSPSFSCRPGSKASTLPPGGRYSMEQKVMLLQGVLHLLTADIAVDNSQPWANVDAGTIEFYADSVLLNRVKFKGIHAWTTMRRQVCIRFTPQATGLRALKIVFMRDWGAQALTPRHHIDNIRLLRAPIHPLLCPRGERKIGGSLAIDCYGAANTPFIVFVAGSRIAPLSIPGFGGAWELALPPRSLVTFVSAFDGLGSKRMGFALPAATFSAIAGVPLFWQSIEVKMSGPTIGTLASFGVYR